VAMMLDARSTNLLDLAALPLEADRMDMRHQ
jgi:hypothetical protein